MGEKYIALIDFIGPRDEQVLDPAALDFTMKPWSNGCRTCLFSGQWSAVCNQASALAIKQGMRDCQNGFIYVAKQAQNQNNLNSNMGKAMPKENSEVLIASGMHQFQHGRISKIDNATEIPFAHIQLRGARGQILVTRGAYVPLKYCVELDQETIRTVSKEAKARRKERRVAEKAALNSADQAPADKTINWA